MKPIARYWLYGPPIADNARLLVSRNKREGLYKGVRWWWELPAFATARKKHWRRPRNIHIMLREK